MSLRASFLVLLLALCAAANAQTEDCKVFGKVEGRNDAPLGGARVTLTFRGHNMDDFPRYPHPMEAVTNRQGEFEFKVLFAGSYRIEIQHDGYVRQAAFCETSKSSPCRVHVKLRLLRSSQ
jgi:uncharacterized GH25 family protein